MIEFLQSLVRGLGSGSIIALLALGFVIIYKAMRVISFAQPGFLLAGAVMVTYFVDAVGFYLAVVLAVAGTALLALGVERVAIRPMVGRPVFAIVIITLGVDIIVRVIASGYIGTEIRQVGDPWGLKTISVGDVTIAQRHIAMLVTAAVLVTALLLFFKYTRFGIGMTAASLDQETALAQGVSVSAVFAVAWAMAGGLAAIAGMFAGTGTGVDQALWLVAFKALPAIIIGGLDSFGGAVVGGLVVGIVESLVTTYQDDLAPWLGQNFSLVSPYVIMLLVLLIRPYGLFGTREVQRI